MPPEATTIIRGVSSSPHAFGDVVIKSIDVNLHQILVCCSEPCVKMHSSEYKGLARFDYLDWVECWGNAETKSLLILLISWSHYRPGWSRPQAGAKE